MPSSGSLLCLTYAPVRPALQGGGFELRKGVGPSPQSPDRILTNNAAWQPPVLHPRPSEEWKIAV